MGIIYLLTAPTEQLKGKKEQYVGKTINTFECRWSSHKSKGKKGATDGCRKLNAYLHKYGADNFQKEILIECPDDMLDYYETKFIALYDTLDPNGLNLTTGGEGSLKSESTKEKMRESAQKRDSAPYRKKEETKNFPKYMGTVNNDYQKGFKISKHPNCNSKYFCDSEKSMDQNEQECREFLDKLNKGEVKVDRPVRLLPEGIQNQANGYRIHYTRKDGKLMTKQFTNTSIPIETRLASAIADLEKIKQADT